MNIMIRDASLTDAPRILEIYRYYVENTAITFEYETPSLEEYRNRMRNTMKRYPYLVVEADGKVAGFTYADAYRERAAYDWCCEVTIYLDHSMLKCGLGKLLYQTLEEKLKDMGITNLYALIGYPVNPNAYVTTNSADFHAHMGYQKIAHLNKCGYKFGIWYDLLVVEKMIGKHLEEQPPIQNYRAVDRQKEGSVLEEIFAYGASAEEMQTEDKDVAENRQGLYAAVLIPLVKKGNEWHLLFEVRSSKLNRQPGEICFPGGRAEKNENGTAAAIRETCEELLIKNDQISILEEGKPVMGPRGQMIQPIVGVIRDYDDTFSSDEVETTFTVPVKWFLKHEPESYEVWMGMQPGEDFPYDRIPGGKQYPWGGQKRTIYFYQYEERTIWGFTAHVVVDFLRKHKTEKN